MGTGGYRLGAGRPGWHVKAEHCLRLDVRDLARRGLLSSGGSFVWTWSWADGHTERRSSSISITTAFDSIRLNFCIGDTPVQQRVDIDRTACNYGGARPWFRCPRCFGRVAVLYLRSGRFGCRRCGQLVYSSQCEDALGRSWRLQRKLEARLGDNWARPKGMHEATRTKIMSKILECQDVREIALASYFLRLSPLLSVRLPR